MKIVKYSLTICTNRTVRGKDLRIVNEAFQSVKESGCDQVTALKFVDPYGSYGPYELKIMAITKRTNRTVRGKGLRIVNKGFQSVKESVCD